MDVFAIIDGINARKTEIKMTSQQIADASGIPKSSVDRVLRKSTDNPSAQVIFGIAEAVGYRFSENQEMPTAVDSNSNQYISHIISMYQDQLTESRRDRNLVTAEKNRWIALSFALNIILVVFLCAILTFDVLHPDIGWVRQQLGLGVEQFNNLIQGAKDFIRTFV